MNAAPADGAADCRLDADVVVEDERWSALGEIEALVSTAAQAAFAGAKEAGPAYVAIALLDDAAVAVLNRQFRGMDKPTNVLSFPANDEGPASDDHDHGRSLGDIALAYDTIDAEARQMGLEFRDHVAHLVVHGVLHLLGFDHESDAEAEEMEALETTILAGMGIADPYAQ